MRKILEIDAKDYHPSDEVIKRIAVRAIIYQKPYIYLIQSDKYKEYKFPGGGANPNESHLETLRRETKEETGIKIKDDIKAYGYVIEKRKSIFEANKIFMMQSYYYRCEIDSMHHGQNLDPYEEDYGYQLKKVIIDDAIKQNELLLKNDHKHIPWVKRELHLLKLIKEER